MTWAKWVSANSHILVIQLQVALDQCDEEKVVKEQSHIHKEERKAPEVEEVKKAAEVEEAEKAKETKKPENIKSFL